MRSGSSAESGAPVLPRDASRRYPPAPVSRRPSDRHRRPEPAHPLPAARPLPGRRAHGLSARLYPPPQHAKLRPQSQELSLHRADSLPGDAHQPALLGRLRADVLLHGAVGGRVDRARDGHGPHPEPRLPGGPLGPHGVPPAHGGDARRHVARLDDDVQSHAGRAQLPPAARRAASEPLGRRSAARDSQHRAGRRLALRALRHADPARRAPIAPARAVRVGDDRRSVPLADLLAHHRAACSSPCWWSC